MMFVIGRIALGLALMIMVTSCATAESYNERNDFSKMTSEQRQSFILGQPLERQVEVYIDMLRVIRPPDLSLESALASNGERIIPDLKKEIQRSESDVVKVHLIMVFYRMQRSEIYSVQSDERLMTFLDDEASAIENPDWREMALQQVAMIRNAQSSELPQN